MGNDIPTLAAQYDIKINSVAQKLHKARKRMSSDDLADLGAWDTFNRETGRRRNQGAASKRTIEALREEGWGL